MPDTPHLGRDSQGRTWRPAIAGMSPQESCGMAGVRLDVNLCAVCRFWRAPGTHCPLLEMCDGCQDPDNLCHTRQEENFQRSLMGLPARRHPTGT